MLRVIDKYTFPNTEWWVFWIVSESPCGVYSDDAWAFEMKRGKVRGQVRITRWIHWLALKMRKT